MTMYSPLRSKKILLGWRLFEKFSEYADLATEQGRHLTTGKRAERTKLDLRRPICRSAIGQASCLICARSSTNVFVLLLNLPQTDLATGRKRHLTTGKRAVRTNSTSGAQFVALPLVKLVV